ncbi:hypothetical protein LTR85_009307 [Meristemomyces frigidus]|nr:hypothetical protein LTR85_009307 [Meristemomyces frigidus]
MNSTDASDNGSLLQIVSKHRPQLEPFIEAYKTMHQLPELSRQESKTANLTAKHLANKGFEIIQGIRGFSTVGILRNGPGKKVLLRADMDALPILEATSLPYASERCMIDVVDGQEKPVMHACGHDMHTACLMAAASCLAAAREHWSGTLICLFQPDEEVGAGARSMIADGLYDKIPRPDLLLAQHVFPLRAGVVSLLHGPVFSALDEFRVRVFGKGGHAPRPEACVDPVVLAAHIIVRLQSVVSREVPPRSVAMITCGSIHGGSASNVIADHVEFTLSIRSYEPSVRSRVLNAIMRTIKSECEISGSPKTPEIERTDEAPPVINDETLTRDVRHSFEASFRSDVQAMTPTLASEDFPYLACGDMPYVYWTIGCIEPSKWDGAEAEGTVDELPGLHSAGFAPCIDPTLQRGADALAIAALTFLGAERTETSR